MVTTLCHHYWVCYCDRIVSCNKKDLNAKYDRTKLSCHAMLYRERGGVVVEHRTPNGEVLGSIKPQYKKKCYITLRYVTLRYVMLCYVMLISEWFLREQEMHSEYYC